MSAQHDPRLWNADIAPTLPAQRTCTWLTYAGLWVAMVIQIPAYLIAADLIAAGMSWWQAVLTVFLGNVIVLIPLVLIGHAGVSGCTPAHRFHGKVCGEARAWMPASVWRMKGRAMRKLLPFLLTCVLSVSAAAQSDTPPRATIVAMAQHLVQEQYMHGGLGHYHIEFDVSYLHPQPESNYWAVVGGFISDQNTPNTYVAAVRLICPDHDNVACWQLDKLAINRKIIMDKGKPI